MKKRTKQGTKKPRQLATSNRFPLLEKELHKQTKVELVTRLLVIAKKHSAVARELEDLLMIEKPVILAIKAVGGDEARKWAGEMQAADRMGFICDQELAALRRGL